MSDGKRAYEAFVYSNRQTFFALKHYPPWEQLGKDQQAVWEDVANILGGDYNRGYREGFGDGYDAGYEQALDDE